MVVAIHRATDKLSSRKPLVIGEAAIKRITMRIDAYSLSGTQI